MLDGFITYTVRWSWRLESIAWAYLSIICSGSYWWEGTERKVNSTTGIILINLTETADFSKQPRLDETKMSLVCQHIALPTDETSVVMFVDLRQDQDITERRPVQVGIIHDLSKWSVVDCGCGSCGNVIWNGCISRKIYQTNCTYVTFFRQLFFLLLVIIFMVRSSKQICEARFVIEYVM
jgi:hypothetical protein